MFFPNTKTHSWADMLLVRPIDESPEPLAYGTHCSCLESVKDLTAPRRFIMHKLAVEMLNVTDRLHQGVCHMIVSINIFILSIKYTVLTFYLL